MSALKCNCIECRIREAIGSSESEPIDIGPAVLALGNVMSELLAHVPTRTAKAAAADLLRARKEWLAHPRVAAQHPKGNA